MLKIKTTAEIVEMSEIYQICEDAGLGLDLEAADVGFADLIFDEVCFSDGEYKRLSRTSIEWYEDELNAMIEENYIVNKEYILYLRCMIAIQKALKEAGVEKYVLVEIGV